MAKSALHKLGSTVTSEAAKGRLAILPNPLQRGSSQHVILIFTAPGNHASQTYEDNNVDKANVGEVLACIRTVHIDCGATDSIQIYTYVVGKLVKTLPVFLPVFPCCLSALISQ